MFRKGLKGVPALTPALLWCIAIAAAPLYGGDFSLSASGGSLLVTPDGMSGYTLGGLSYKGEPGPYLTMGAGKIFLNLSRVQGDITIAAGRFGFQVKNFGAAFAAGVFSHSAFKADFGQTVFNSEGGGGSFFDTALLFGFTNSPWSPPFLTPPRHGIGATSIGFWESQSCPLFGGGD